MSDVPSDSHLPSTGAEIVRPWRSNQPVPLNPAASVAGAGYALGRYAQFGVKAHPQNRLRDAQRYLSRFVGTDEALADRSEATLRRIVEATQTCFEHYLIARSSGPPSQPLPQATLEKLSLSLTGAPTSDADANSVGRDTQSELFVRALFVMGGVRTRLEEPDLRFLVGDQELGIAVKRVKRPSKLNTRFREGVKQIEKSGCRGFVAINTDLLIRDLGTGGHSRERGSSFDKRISVLHRLDDRYSENPSVLGRFAFGTDSVWHFDNDRPVAEFSFFRQVRVYPANVPEAEAMTRFFDQMDLRITERMAAL